MSWAEISVPRIGRDRGRLGSRSFSGRGGCFVCDVSSSSVGPGVRVCSVSSRSVLHLREIEIEKEGEIEGEGSDRLEFVT